jgi:hypothetical protein
MAAALAALILLGCGGPQAPAQQGGQPKEAPTTAAGQPPAQTGAEPQTGRGNTPGNIVNDGLAATDGEWIYYSNPADEGRLYKMKPDGSGKTKLSDNKDAEYINVVGGWVYYARSGSYIYRVRTNGKDEAQLSKTAATYVSVVDGWIYYHNKADKGAIYRMKTDGSEVTKLNSQTSSYINVADGWVYYIDITGSQLVKGPAYRMRVDGSEQTRLGDRIVSNLNVAGGYLYYTEHPEGGEVTTGRMKLDGSEATTIANDNYRYLNVTADSIYYAPDQDSGQLYRAALDGSGATRLADDKHVKSINVVGDWIYYDVSGGEPQWVKVDGSGKRPVD